MQGRQASQYRDEGVTVTENFCSGFAPGAVAGGQKPSTPFGSAPLWTRKMVKRGLIQPVAFRLEVFPALVIWGLNLILKTKKDFFQRLHYFNKSLITLHQKKCILSVWGVSAALLEDVYIVRKDPGSSKSSIRHKPENRPWKYRVGSAKVESRGPQGIPEPDPLSGGVFKNHPYWEIIDINQMHLF